MTLLPANDLAQFRATQAEAWPDTCEIQNPTETNTGTGHTQDTWGTIAAAQACRFMPMRGDDERLVAAQIVGDQGYMLTIAHDGTIEPGYRVVIGSGTYEVMTVEEAGSWKTAKRAICKVVDPQ